MIQNRSIGRWFGLFCLCLLIIFLALFYESLDPSKVVFANDGPLGSAMQAGIRLPAAFTGVWYDLNTLGTNGGVSVPDISQLFFWVLGPLGCAKAYALLTLLILGLCAWTCFRMLRLSQMACLLGALAAVLNGGYFSVSCWGVGPQTITAGMNFLAIGLFFSYKSSRDWLRLVLAGMAVGMGVVEGFDIGALYSLVFGSFVMFWALSGDGPVAKRATRGILNLAVIAVLAGFVAFQAVDTIVNTQIKGIVGTKQDAETKAAHWDWATQWSFPKKETLSLFVPGLFGYRMDTPTDVGHFPDWIPGGGYCLAMGRDPAWDRYYASGEQGPAPDPSYHFMRYSGGGNYAGVLVTLLALWTALRAFLRSQSP